MDYQLVILIILFAAFLLLSIKNIFSIIFKNNELKTYSQRQRQILSIENRNRENENSVIEKITNPFLNFPFIHNYNLCKIKSNLIMSHWDEYFNPKQYLIINLLLKFVGTILAILFLKESIIFSAIFFILFFFIMDILMKNTINERREKIFNQFPKYVRLMDGYLSAKMTIVEATEKTLVNVGDEWKRLLTNFLVSARKHGSTQALDELKNATDIFEIKELMSLIKLSLEQGTEISDSFKRQITLIEEVQALVYEKKIIKRQMIGQAIQAPLFLALMVAFALPIFAGAFSTLGGM